MFSIRLVRSKRKTISIEVDRIGLVTVRAPLLISEKRIMEFVEQKKLWIHSAIEKQKNLPSPVTVSKDEKERLRSLARLKIPNRVMYWSNLTGLSYSSVRITSAEKRFGSCSAKNALCFSLYLVNYPDDLVDYVIVHELCHTKEHNHSSAFYALVESFLPDWKDRQQRLRAIPLPGPMPNN